MNVSELRGFLKDRGIRGFSTLKKSELEAKVKKLKEQERAEKYEEDLRHNVCLVCLKQQRIQRKIDEKMYNQRLLELTMRDLVCEYCKHAKFVVDGDHTVCVDCGALQSPDAVGGYRN